jgi:hypothetical protein
VFDRAGYEELPSNNLYACILRAANGDTKEKIQGLRLLPDELASYLHTLRTFSNKPDHAVEQIKLSRAVDKMGQTIDCLLTEERDEQTAKRFLTKAIRRHGVPEKITIDGSAANEAAIKSYNEEHGTAIAIRKIKWRKDVVCRVHRSPPRGHRGRASHPWPGPWQVAKHPIGVAPCLI